MLPYDPQEPERFRHADQMPPGGGPAVPRTSALCARERKQSVFGCGDQKRLVQLRTESHSLPAVPLTREPGRTGHHYLVCSAVQKKKG